MEKNIGTVDRIIRIVLAVVLSLTGWLYFSAQYFIVSVVLYIISVMLIITAITSFCLPYTWFGFNTLNKKETKKTDIKK